MSFIPECFKSPPFSKLRTIKNRELDTTDERKTENTTKKTKVYGIWYNFIFSLLKVL